MGCNRVAKNVRMREKRRRAEEARQFDEIPVGRPAKMFENSGFTCKDAWKKHLRENDQHAWREFLAWNMGHRTVLVERGAKGPPIEPASDAGKGELKRYQWSLARHKFKQDREAAEDAEFNRRHFGPLAMPVSRGIRNGRYEHDLRKWQGKMKDRGFAVSDEAVENALGMARERRDKCRAASTT